MVSMGVKPGVFLDRDGVIVRSIIRNRKPYAVRNLKAFRILPGVQQAISQLKQAGFLLIVVTNQPDIGKGLISEKVMNKMNDILLKKLKIDDIKLCPHKKEDKCVCRKPKPRLIVRAAKEYNIDLSKSYMIGDRLSDMIAGQKAGCKCIFIDRGYEETKRINIEIDLKTTSLPAAVRLIEKLESAI